MPPSNATPTSSAGQPIELFDSKRGRLPVIFELLASPWIVRASELERADGSCAAKRAEEDVDVVWDAARQYPSSFTRDGRTYRIDAIVQIWAAERAWWDPRRRVSRRFWRVLSRGGVYDLAYDREQGIVAAHRHPGLTGRRDVAGIRASARALAVQLHGRGRAARRTRRACGRTRDACARAHRSPGLSVARSGSTRHARQPGSCRSSAARSWSRPPVSSATRADLPPEKRLVLPASVGFGRASAAGYPPHAALSRLRWLPQPVPPALAHAPARAARAHRSSRCTTSAAHAEGLIALSGCLNGEAASAVLARAPGRAREALARLSACFAAGDFYVELTHPLTADGPRLVGGLVTLADELSLPVVATNDVHYLKPADHRLHDVLAAAGARMALPGPVRSPQRRAVAQARRRDAPAVRGTAARV